jgi:hypothetical protein
MADVTGKKSKWPGPNRVADMPEGVRVYDPPALGRWKGLEFLCESSETTGGRSIAKISPPYIPGQIVHDMGRKGQAITLKTVWIGDNWKARLQNFRAVVEGEASSGELAMPDGGAVLTAHVETFQEPRAYDRDSCEFTLTMAEDSQVDAVLAYSQSSSASDGVPPTDTEVHALIDAWETACNDPDATPEEIDEARANADSAITESESALDTDTVDGVEAEEGYEQARGRVADGSEDKIHIVPVPPGV